MRVAALVVLAAAALAVPSSARDRGVPVATATGKPVQCVPIQAIRESLVRDDRTIDFRMTGNRTYRITLPQRCPGLGFERRFAYATSLSQLCANDIITVLQQGPQMRGASCGLAPFQPVNLAARR